MRLFSSAKFKFLFLVFSLLFGLSFQSHGKAVYLGMLQSAYQVQAPQRCNVCHSTTSLALNPFGKDFSNLKRELGSDRLPEVWKRLGELDSDKDGISNIQELVNSLNPGVPSK